MMVIGGRGLHVEVLNAVQHDLIGFTYQHLETYGRQVNRNLVDKLPPQYTRGPTADINLSISTPM